MNSPRRELSNGGLGIVVTLLVACQINYLCASTGSAIQLYVSAALLLLLHQDRRAGTRARRPCSLLVLVL